MARDTLTGSRIRERRVMAGMKQSDLARFAGISPSYLNLIEHNRRRIGGKLLVAISHVLKVEPSLLTQGAEATLIATLREAAQDRGRGEDGSASPPPPETALLEEFAGRFPGWAWLLADSQRRMDALERTVERLTDRMTHDPHLAASLHEMLSTVTAIRSTAAILAEPGEIEPEWRDRFHRNLNEDSKRLADSSQALVRYLDTVDDVSTDLGSPQEEVDAFLDCHGWNFATLEEGGSIEDILKDSDLGPVSLYLLEQVLGRYAEDVAALPMALLLDALNEVGPDPLALSLRTRVDPGRVMRRLAALPASAGVGRFGLAACDASGTLIFRKALKDFPLPRYGAACALWPLFTALSRPNVVLTQELEQTGRDPAHFRAYAVAQPVGTPQLNRDPMLVAHMLLVPQETADVSGDPLRVGVSCRICPRTECEGRREPSILAESF
ncbi:helix-turn-helix domain-containing protein [Primorskyibacter marinus]|uniref:helix-turn-helix domain-containing protein n=1 Tax=Primorskyibacter marinus TaxID=1977320 RepID=UPI000E3086E1|nr:helix-turn-helix transcriptional regulator [Primorskyibacter marinus]